MSASLPSSGAFGEREREREREERSGLSSIEQRTVKESVAVISSFLMRREVEKGERKDGGEVGTDLVNREPDAQVLHSHLLLLAAMFLHECDQTGAFAVSVRVLCEVNDELGVVGEGRVVATSSTRALGSEPAPRFDDAVPVLD